MTPTRRIHDTQTTHAVAPSTRPTKAAETASTAAVGAVAKIPADRAVSVDLSITAQVRSDTSRMDTQRLQTLKEQVSKGTYEVDPKALAQRIAEEALEPELLE